MKNGVIMEKIQWEKVSWGKKEKKKKTEQITKSPWIVKTSLLYYNLILVPKCIYFFLDILEFKYSLDSVTNHRLVTFCTGI